MKKHKVNLYHIQTLQSVNDLYSYYDDIIKFAKAITPTDEIAHDTAHDAILRLVKYIEQGKEVNGGYIASTLFSQYDRYISKETRYIKVGDTLSLDAIDTSDGEIEIKLHFETMFIKYESILDKLHWYNRSVLKYSLEMPLTQLSQETGIGYWSLRNTLIKVYNELGVDYQQRNK